jgi:putative phage-type endonuclease
MSNPLQRTDEWHKAREGRLTASMFGSAAGLGPGSWQQAWRRVLGIEVFEGNEATDWGVEHEPTAIGLYTTLHHKEKDWQQTGFHAHPQMDWLGCSPDLLVGESGLAEIKCPFSKQAYTTIPIYYMAQMQGQMQIMGRDWCDFVVWTPEAMTVQRVPRSNDYWDWLHLRLADFWTYVQAQIEPPRMSKKEQPPPVKEEATLMYRLTS